LSRVDDVVPLDRVFPRNRELLIIAVIRPVLLKDVVVLLAFSPISLVSFGDPFILASELRLGSGDWVFATQGCLL